jgi:hypothetical protein
MCRGDGEGGVKNMQILVKKLMFSYMVTQTNVDVGMNTFHTKKIYANFKKYANLTLKYSLVLPVYSETTSISKHKKLKIKICSGKFFLFDLLLLITYKNLAPQLP